MRRKKGKYWNKDQRDRFIATLLVCFVVLSAGVHGEEAVEDPDSGQAGAHPFGDWARETGRAAKGTFANEKNLAVLGATALGSVALMATGGDKAIRDAFDDFGLPKPFDDAGNLLGASPPLLAVGLYVHGKTSDNERSAEVGKVLASALAIDAASTGAMKLALGRHRPKDGVSAMEFEPFSFDNRSFPSGHTSFSFMTATVMADMYDDRPWVRPAAYTTATLIGISRISSDEHWASDVLFGAVKGYLIGKTVTRLHKRWKLEDVDIVANFAGPDKYVGLNVRF